MAKQGTKGVWVEEPRRWPGAGPEPDPPSVANDSASGASGASGLGVRAVSASAFFCGVSSIHGGMGHWRGQCHSWVMVI